MKKLLYLVVLLIMPLAGWGQSPTAVINGSASGIGQTLTNPITLQIQLIGCGQSVPQLIPSGSVISNNYTVTADPTTHIATATVYGNDVISCGGQTYTLYAVTWNINGRPAAPTQNYRIIQGQTCSVSDGTCKAIGFTPPQINNATGFLCPTGQNLQGFNSQFVPQCVLAPPVGPAGPQGPAGAAGGAQVAAGITTLLKGTGTINQTVAAIAGTDYPGLGFANSFSSLQTMAAGLTVTGTVTVPGGYTKLNPTSGNQAITQTAGTSLNVNSLNTTLNASMFSGADAGAQINAAYAALPASGGMLIYPVPTGGLSFSTSINFNTANKPVVLSCFSASGSGNDTLVYTSTGTGITFNNGPSSVANGPSGSGIRDCDIQATNSAATLVFLGGTNGAEGAYISNSKFFGGALTIGLGDNTWDVKFNHVKIYGGTQLLVTSGSTNAGENIQFDHVAFLSSGTFANGVVLGGSSSGAGLNAQCNSCSFDNTQLVVTGGEIEINSSHFEDPGAVQWPSSPLLINGGSVALNTATFFGDHPAGTLMSSYISITSGILTTDALTTFGCNCTNIYASSGTGKILGGSPMSLAGPAGAVITLIADTSSELSTVDGGRNYALHNEGPHNIHGWLTFDNTASGVHVRKNNVQAGIGSYVEMPGFRLVDTPDLAGYYTGKMQVARCTGSGYSSTLNFYTESKNTANQTDTSRVTGSLDCFGGFSSSGTISIGTTFSATGCSVSALSGGSSVGTFHSGVTGTCTVAITMGSGLTSPNGWYCGRVNDFTTPSDSNTWTQTGNAPTNVILSGTAVAGDVIQFGCLGY